MQVVVVVLIALCAVAKARPEADVGVQDVIPGVGEYYFNGIPANWSTAYRQCQSSGGLLTVINSVKEKEALQEMMTRHGASSVLIGFHDQFVEGVYSFITGTGLSANDNLWAPAYPVGGVSSNCGYLNSAGIFDGSCTTLSTFICELSEDQGGENVTDTYTPVGNYGSFKFHNESLTWPQAWEACREENADLMVVDSEAELLAVWNALPQFSVSGYIWIGVHRKWGPDDFVSVKNTPLSELGYQKWVDASEPMGSYQNYPYVVQYALNGMGTSTSSASISFICKRSS